MTVGMRGAGGVVKNLFLVCYEETLFFGGGEGGCCEGVGILINKQK